MIIQKNDASGLLLDLGEEFARVQNPSYVYPPMELYPLAPKPAGPAETLKALVMDMDGTTTTTEELCIYSLEYMVRRMGGRMDKQEWAGLDPVADYPNIIGNSTTKHIEFLYDKYGATFQDAEVLPSFLYAAAWTLAEGKDLKRQQEVRLNLRKYGMGAVLESVALQMWIQAAQVPAREQVIASLMPLATLPALQREDYVQLGIDVYYQMYHEILARILKGESQQVTEMVFGAAHHGGKHLIEPTQGINILLPLVKGWLGADAALLAPALLEAYEKKAGRPFAGSKAEAVETLARLGRHFEANPAKLALVTSSIFYEANIVIGEVFSLIAQWVRTTSLPKEKREFIAEQFADYHRIYETFVTASDAHETRLKPHRDLYSIALYQLGIAPEDFGLVAGFEDSTSGTVAIRAAGVGRCVAVPFAQTAGHNLKAASDICLGGIPEVILDHKLFIRK